jgi:hypothetical protein
MKTIKFTFLFLILIASSIYPQIFLNALQFSNPGDFIKVYYDYPTTYIYNELWFRADSIPSNSMISVSAWGQGSPEMRNCHYYLFVNADGNLNFSVRVTLPSVQWIHLVGNTIIQAGTWHHVYIAFSNYNKYEIWLDGKSEASNNGHGYGWLGKVTTVPPLLTIATSFEGGDSTYIFYGSIDEVRIWNVYRDSVQINSTMLDTLSSYYYSSQELAGYWRFDEFEDLGVNGDGVDDLRDLALWTRHGDANGNPELVPSYLVSVDNSNATIPFCFLLSQNYPNPFNPSTIISYQLPVSGNVTLKVYDLLGREVATLVDEYKSVGRYETKWNASNYPTGVYFYQMKVGEFIETKKMILLK